MAESRAADAGQGEVAADETRTTRRTCRICGWACEDGDTFARHVWKKHRMSVDDYRHPPARGTAPGELAEGLMALERRRPHLEGRAAFFGDPYPAHSASLEIRARRAQLHAARAHPPFGTPRPPFGEGSASSPHTSRLDAADGIGGLALFVLAGGVAAGLIFADGLGVGRWAAAGGGLLAGIVLAVVLNAYVRAMGGHSIDSCYAEGRNPWMPDLEVLPIGLRVITRGVAAFLVGGGIVGHYLATSGGWWLPLAIIAGLFLGLLSALLGMAVVGWAGSLLLWLFRPCQGRSLLLPLVLGAAGFLLAGDLGLPRWVAAPAGFVLGAGITAVLVSARRAIARRGQSGRHVEEHVDDDGRRCTFCSCVLQPASIASQTKVLEVGPGAVLPLQCDTCHAKLCSECLADLNGEVGSGVWALPTPCPLLSCGGSVHLLRE